MTGFRKIMGCRCDGAEPTWCNDAHPSSLSDDFSSATPNWSPGTPAATITNTGGVMALSQADPASPLVRAFSPDFSAAVQPTSLVTEIELRSVPAGGKFAQFEVNPFQLGRDTGFHTFIYASSTTYHVGAFGSGGTPILGPAIPLISPTVGDVWRLEFDIDPTDEEIVTDYRAKINGTAYKSVSGNTTPLAGLNHCGINSWLEFSGSVDFDNFSATYS